MIENRFCVYGYFENGVCFYVGHGNSKRLYVLNKSRSEKLLNKLRNSDFEIKILENNLTRKNAIDLKMQYINKL